MKTKCMGKRARELLGLMMIGEGVTGLIQPQQYLLFWKIGPRWLRDAAETFAQHPRITRAFCAGEIAAGLWLALREIEKR